MSIVAIFRNFFFFPPFSRFELLFRVLKAKGYDEHDRGRGKKRMITPNGKKKNSCNCLKNFFSKFTNAISGVISHEFFSP